MADTTKKVLTFKAEDGTTLTMMIPESRKDLTESEVKALIDILIQNKIFTASSGHLVVE
jgi:hypothetical protein